MQKLQQHQMNQAVTLLSTCFANNPLFIYLVPNEKRRQQALKPFLACILHQMMHIGMVYTTSNQIEGIIACVTETPTQKHRLPLSFYIKCAFLLLTQVSWVTLLQAYFRYQRKTVKFVGSTQLVRQLKTYQSIQLFAIDPAHRHQGYARQLLVPLLQQAQRANLVSVLETETLNLVLMYEHFDFEVVGKFIYGNQAWEQYIMIHDPNQLLLRY